MGGMKSLFTKLIPIVMLVCFLCLGITHTFGRFDAETGQSDITYLSKETIETGTQDHPYELTYYELDVNGYMQGIDNNVLKRSLSQVIDLEAYQSILNKFNEIWKDGYQFLDGVKTIVNSVLLVINTIILPINVLLIPLRIISGILLTAFTLIGININRDSVIINSLNGIIDYAHIPFISTTTNVDEDTRLNNTEWRYNNTGLDLRSSIWSKWTYFYFESNGTEYCAINNKNNKLYYCTWEDGSLQDHVVYENEQWINQNYRYITILDKNSLTEEEVNEIYTFLYTNGDYIDNSLSNTYWTFNNSFTFTETEDKYFYFYSYTNLGTSYYGLKVGADNKLYYINIQNSSYVYETAYENGQWTNNAYKNIHIVQQTMYSKTTLVITSLLTQNATQT